MQIIRVISFLALCFSIMVTVVTTFRDHILPGDAPPLFSSRQKDDAANDNNPLLSEQGIRHILYGDESGGGHLYGMKIPCKSEFPRSWSGEDIIATVQSLAANDNMRWEQQENGYHVAEQMVEGVQVRIVLDREMDDIVTAYPTNRIRNPCP